jgi:hypothetical protein
MSEQPAGHEKRTPDREPGDWIGSLIAWVLLIILAVIVGGALRGAAQIDCEQLRAIGASDCLDPSEKRD